MARWKFLANLLSLTAVSLMTPRQEACSFNSVLEREVEEIVEILLGFLAFRLFTGCSIPTLGCKQSPKSDTSLETSALRSAVRVPFGSAIRWTLVGSTWVSSRK